MKPKPEQVPGQYHLVLVRVDSKDEFGRPSQVTIGYDDTTFNLTDGEEFYTAYIHENALPIHTKGNA